MTTTRAAEMVLPVTKATPYLRVRIRTDDDELTVRSRRALLFFIPLWRRTVTVPLTDLSAGVVRVGPRVDCLAGAVAIAAVIVLLALPLAAEIALGVVAAFLALVSVTRMLRVVRIDGRTWSFPICWDYAFDASLAIADALGRREGSPTLRGGLLPDRDV
jgi:hypothetical protein